MGCQFPMFRLYFNKTNKYAMENNPEYFSEIVYLRSIAILAVISIHVSAYFTEMSTISFLTFIYMSIDTFSHFAVPLFVCISGFVLFNKYQGSYSLHIFYKKRFLSVVPPYILFSLFGILFVYVGKIYFGKFWNFNIIDIISQYLTGEAFFQPWFFLLIIQLYILYPVIERLFAKSVQYHKTLYLLIGLLFIQIVYQIVLIGEMYWIGTATLFLGYSFYFVLGMFVRLHYPVYKNRIFLIQNHFFTLFSALLLATLLSIVTYYIEYFESDHFLLFSYIYNWIAVIVMPLYYILIFMVCLFIALNFLKTTRNEINKIVKIIGNYSFGIYLVHVFVVYGVASILLPKVGLDMNNWLFYPIVFTLVLIISLAFLSIINKLPYHEYIIGSLR
jgi:probable poly-beta-1,6-N-acetyl-D-glucosamine export protein